MWEVPRGVDEDGWAVIPYEPAEVLVSDDVIAVLYFFELGNYPRAWYLYVV